MKPQDILFIVLVIGLFLFRRKPGWFAGGAFAFLLLSVPLYVKWVFFTAERFVWYAAFFFFLSIMLHIYYARK